MLNASNRCSRRASRAVGAIVMLAALDGVGLPDVASAASVSQRWVAQYGGGDYATALSVSPDGSTVFVTGSNGGRRIGGGDYVTVAYDAATGTRLWLGRYDGPAGASDSATALGVSADGSRVFVTGVSEASTDAGDYATVAYDSATGAELWVTRYGRVFGDDRAVALGASSDGAVVFVTGRSRGARGVHRVTVAYAAASGRQLWVARRENGYVSALDVSPDDSTVFITGGSGASYSKNFSTLAYDVATGAELWVRRYHGPEHRGEGAEAVGVSPDGSQVFVTGFSFGPGMGVEARFEYATVAYDTATGTELWVRRFEGPGNDVANALAVSPDGSTVFVTGDGSGESTFDYATVAYDAARGAELWVERYEGPGNRDDRANALVVSPDGSEVFVTGESWGESMFDYATVAYDAATGAELWVERYDGPAGYRDVATSLGISPDGSALFVTGSSLWPDSYDAVYTTVAYDVG